MSKPSIAHTILLYQAATEQGKALSQQRFSLLLAINFLSDDVHSIAYFSLQCKHHMSFRPSDEKGLTNLPSTIYSLTGKRFLEILMAKLLRKRQQPVSDDALIFSQRVMHTDGEQVQNSGIPLVPM
jgi:hypothetical protein